MKIKLFDGARNDYNNIKKVLEQVLENRGVENPNEYLKLIKEDNVQHNPLLLDNIEIARDRLINAVENKEYIHIIVDSDPDGYCSSAILYSYIKNNMNYTNIGYSLHTGKQHGITNDIKIPEETKLLLIPDASSNDYSEHKKLKLKGIDIIVLDHHEAEKVSEDAIVVNNQLCNYPNKCLSGAGIVYKFLKVLDDELWIDGADKYLDLVALALISDSMDIKDVETRYYIDLGLTNIRNNCFKAFIDKRFYDIKNHVNPINVAFYITPLINALIRVGKQDEKELLFKAFIDEYMVFKYKKRGQDELVDENIYDRVARLSTNARSRQSNQLEKILDNIHEDINIKKKYKNNLIVVNGEGIDKSLTGLVAIKIASKYQKPTIVIRKDEKTNKYAGSGRNPDYSSIEDLREYINNTKLANAEGHAGAFGIMDLESQNVNKLIDYFNSDSEVKDSLYWVDFIIPWDDLSDELMYELVQLKDYWGQGIKEPVIAITDIKLINEEIGVTGKNLDTLKISTDGIEFIKFRCNPDDELINNTNDEVVIDVVGRCGINEWDGKIDLQVVIDNYKIKH